MSANDKNPQGRVDLLWLGAGSLCQSFAGLTAAQQYPQRLAVRRSSQHCPTGFQGLAADFQVPSSLSVLAGLQPRRVVVTLTPPERSDDGYRLGYVAASEHLIAALRQAPNPPEQVVFVSSTSVHSQEDGQWVDETSPAEPQGFSGQRLLQAEQLWLDTGWPVAVVRFSGIYGPGRYRLLTQLCNGQADPQAQPMYTNRIHQHDCAKVIAHLLERPEITGVLLATDNDGGTDWQVRQLLAQLLSVAWPEQPPEVATGGKRISNRALLATGFSFDYPSFREGYAGIVAEYLATRPSS